MTEKEIECWLQSLLGKKLTSIMAELYSLNGEKVYENPISLSFDFEDIEPAKVFCSSDGESISVSEDSLKEFNMDEYGALEIVDFSNREDFKNYIDHTLSDAFLLISNRSQKVIGFKLEFSGLLLSILNLGDEIYTFNYIPLFIIEQEDLSVKSVLF